MNIAEILKDAPKGTRLYSPLAGKVLLDCVDTHRRYPIAVVIPGIEPPIRFTSEGFFYYGYPDAKCLLFPSETQRDWTKFKINPLFPTSLEECYDALGVAGMIAERQYRQYDTECLRNLLIARDAWWKVDNDWKPDWEDDIPKFGIFYICNKIESLMVQEEQKILVFRTAGIRDKFLETYRDLIEKCKELI